ncbi:SMI1/KNR4 family protein [Paracrocinitomix mangrovi]|uniref:SMI1/KNR4 family protein n=1 Tax=Paracrocinitomix mangrovi TaxID=2862509 RepID=UPI001C8E4C6B|nr:SMI1/KNR4 family protein [Paracrocinitomix mangrovi]UKN02705.1 SMI1/KNR4 family protein [Paracrocinitomix mangrovi]
MNFFHHAITLFALSQFLFGCNNSDAEMADSNFDSQSEEMNASESNEIDLWNRIENWTNDNAKDVDFGLNPGATEEDFQSLENVIQAELPSDFKAFYRIHNGQSEDIFTQGLVDGEVLLSTKQIEAEWKIWNDFIENDSDARNTKSDPQLGIKSDWWNKLWIPITSAGTGDFTCIDLDPAPEGKSGQIIRMIHDDTYRELYSSSFSEWFRSYVEGLEAGGYVYSDDWGGIVSKEYVE